METEEIFIDKAYVIDESEAIIDELKKWINSFRRYKKRESERNRP